MPKRRAPFERLAKWLPAFAFLFVALDRLLPFGGIQQAVVALLALFVVMVVSRFPGQTVMVLVVLLPFQVVLYSQLYKWGVPIDIVGPAKNIKEILAAGLVVAAFRTVRSERRPFDVLDKVTFAYLGVILAYALLPSLFAIQSHVDLWARLTAVRQNAAFVALFVACRHIRFPPGYGEKFVRVLLGTGIFVAGVAVIEFTFSNWWNSLLVFDIGVSDYLTDVLGAPPTHFYDLRFYALVGDAEVLRVGSLLLTPLALGFYLAPAFGVALERMLRAKGGAAAPATAALIGAAGLFTQTRSAIITFLVVALLAFRPQEGRSAQRRTRLGLILVAGIAVFVPAAFATGFADRSASTVTGDESADSHWESLEGGVEAIVERPLGHGLATSAGAGQRYRDQGEVEVVPIVTENNYLLQGVEAGVFGMGLFLAMTVLVCRALRREARRNASVLVGGMAGAAVGLAVGAILLQIWIDIPTAWTAWMAFGVALSVSESTPARGERDEGAILDPPYVRSA